jgi:hypothetical protein
LKDFFGQELAIGDAVVMNDKTYSELRLAKIVKFTPTMVRVATYDTRWGKGWMNDTVLCNSHQIVRAEQELVTAFLLRNAK